MNITGKEVRYRPSGEDNASWTAFRIGVNDDIELTGVTRGITYDIEIRNIDNTGRMSEPVSITHTVGSTIREGALALPVNSIANISSVWNVGTSVTFSATDSSATISVSAGSLVIGGEQINYGASSAVVTGDPEVKKTYYLYYDDPTLSGGTLPLGVTEDFITSMSGDGRVAINNIEITFPAVGAPPVTGGGGIGGGGGGGGTKNPAANQQAV